MALTAGTPGRVTRIALFLSLGLNVLLGAYLATHWLAAPRRSFGPPDPARVVALIESRLPAADAKIVRDIYRAREAEITANAKAKSQAVDQAVALITEPQIDPAALRAATEKARAEGERGVDLMLGVLMEALPKLSLEGRRDLVGRFRSR